MKLTAKVRWAFTLLALLVGASTASAQYTPEHPEVQKMVGRGVKYLEGLTEEKDYMGGVTDLGGNGGERVIVAYAHHKCQHDPESPVVKRGVEVALQILNVLRGGRGDHGHKKNYEIAVCILLLAEVDPDFYQSQLKELKQHLVDGQSANGAWAYPGEKEGDTSQTQYALLAIWTLDRAGIPLEYERVVNAMQWLQRVQDPKGGWPYHGADPGGTGRLMTQKRVDMSMTLAGGSSLLIAGDALRLWGETVDDTDPGIDGLPKAIKLYKEDANVKRRKRANISEDSIRRSIGGLNQWRNANPYTKKSTVDWYYYLIYTLERYESFIEISQGKVKDKSPPWYNKVVEELRKAQGADGGWSERKHSRPPVSTAFALLFLIRSTQKTVFNLGSGTLSGGQGLPSDTTNIRVDGTQIKGRPIAADITNMLDLLEKDGADELGDKSLPDNLELSKKPAERAAQMDRLERLVRGSTSYQARRVAARVLGTSDELRVVPSLIFALSDEDERVWQFARDGLRFISRKFDGFDLQAPRKVEPGERRIPTRSDVAAAQEKWREWYKSMNPKYVFLDYDL